MYKRILLKLSGEQLAGRHLSGFDTEFAVWLAGEIKQARDAGVEIVVVIGGGDYVRGAVAANTHIRRVTGDYMGMLATLMNALALTDVLEAEGVPAYCLSNLHVGQIAESFVYRTAIEKLSQGHVVIVGGGAGTPYMTTDTAAVVTALETHCDVVMKATKVDGIYDKDPAEHDNAVRYKKLTLREAIANDQIKVMDRAALGFALEYMLPIVVFDVLGSGNIARVAAGDTSVGTTVTR